MNFRADLHVHSFFSDGTNSPQEILNMAKEIGLQGISITDHDTVQAYSKELFDLAEKLHIYLLPGIEMSAADNVHILGLGVAIEDSSFLQTLKTLQKIREERNRKVIEKLAKTVAPFAYEDIVNYVYQQRNFLSPIIGRAHIAQFLYDKGWVSSYQEAFELYLKEGGKCYVKADYPSAKEVIDIIHSAHGQAVLAHPHKIAKPRLVDQLLQLSFDGIEAYYGKLSPAIEKKWREIAHQKGWIVTGGSDFHGEIRNHIPLGCSWVSKEIFFQLYKEPFREGRL